jgi:hypothetical protein
MFLRSARGDTASNIFSLVHLGIYSNPVEVSGELGGDVRLAACRKSHHADDVGRGNRIAPPRG